MHIGSQRQTATNRNKVVERPGRFVRDRTGEIKRQTERNRDRQRQRKKHIHTHTHTRARARARETNRNTDRKI